MPRLSIKTHVLLWGNLLVLVTALAIGVAGMRITVAGVEKRLTDEAARNAARLIRELHLPLSLRLVKDLQRVNGCDVAIWSATDRRLVASSLAPDGEAALAVALATPPVPPRHVQLAGRHYTVGMAEVGTLAAGDTALLLLAPDSQLAAAGQQAAGVVLLVTALAVLAASALTWWLAGWLARPVENLTARFECLAANAGSDLTPGQEDTALVSTSRGPAELRRLEEAFNGLLTQLRGARERLADSARLAAVGQLSASVAHELRNPLSGIKMNARLLQDELAGAGCSDPSLDIIISESARMELYLQELLNVARHSGQAPRAADGTNGTATTAEVAEIATGILALLAGRCRYAKVDVQTRLAADTGRLRCPPEALRQVLLNLLANALDAMPEGGVLTLSATRAPANTVRCEVRDTGPGVQVGPGMDVFAPFCSTKPHGAGLGLHICRSLVQENGGRIGYTAATPGTVFWFELPGA